jgi:hypothetical protein
MIEIYWVEKQKRDEDEKFFEQVRKVAEESE